MPFDDRKTCIHCYCKFPKTKKTHPGDNPDCCSAKCSYEYAQRKLYNKSHAAR